MKFLNLRLEVFSQKKTKYDELLPENMPEEIMGLVFRRRNRLFLRVKDCINNYHNLSQS